MGLTGNKCWFFKNGVFSESGKPLLEEGMSLGLRELCALLHGVEESSIFVMIFI